MRAPPYWLFDRRTPRLTPLMLHAQHWWRLRTRPLHCTWCWLQQELTSGDAYQLDVGPR